MKRAALILALVALGLLRPGPHARAADGSDEAPAKTMAGIDQAFVCPEGLKTEAARTDALNAFIDDVQEAAPDQGLAQTLDFHRRLLVKHGCAKSLAELQAQADAVGRGDVRHQAWMAVPAGEGVNLYGSTTFTRPYLDPRYANERAVETYVRAVFAAAQTNDVAPAKFDELISHTVYYCDTDRYALIENDYFMKGKPVAKDASTPAQVIGGISLYDLDDLPPDSMNAAASEWACAASPGDVA